MASFYQATKVIQELRVETRNPHELIKKLASSSSKISVAN
jgi:hypothetical protein